MVLCPEGAMGQRRNYRRDAYASLGSESFKRLERRRVQSSIGVPPVFCSRHPTATLPSQEQRGAGSWFAAPVRRSKPAPRGRTGGTPTLLCTDCRAFHNVRPRNVQTPELLTIYPSNDVLPAIVVLLSSVLSLKKHVSGTSTSDDKAKIRRKRTNHEHCKSFDRRTTPQPPRPSRRLRADGPHDRQRTCRYSRHRWRISLRMPP